MSRVNGLRVPPAIAITALAWVGGVVCAQPTTSRETPVLALAPKLTDGETAEHRAAGQAIENARDAGLAWLTEDLAIDALASPGLGTQGRVKILLALTDVRLQRGALREAAQALEQITGQSSQKSLREGLIAYASGNTNVAAAKLNASKPAELDESDRIWRTALDGLLEFSRGNIAAGVSKTDKARQESRHPTVAAQLLILQKRALMRASTPGLDPFAEIGNLLDLLPDARQTYQFGKTQAFALYRAGKKNEALARLALLPVPDKDLRAERDLLAGIIAGGRSPQGRAALLAAIDATGYKEDKEIRRAALSALCEAILATPREEVLLQVNPVYNALTERVESGATADIADHIHLARARLMLFAATGSADAEGATARQKASDALQEIITKYTTSPLLPEALLLSAETARGAAAYRKAAVAYEKLAGYLTGSESADMLMMAADCYAKNNDHANAAAAYANAIKLLDSPTLRGSALLGQIRSLLAQKHTDEAAHTLETASGISEEARLRATWFVADAKRTDGATAAAMRMVKNTLAARTAPPPSVRLRFLWLRALLELAEQDGKKAAATAGEIAAIAAAPADTLPSDIRDNAPAILAQTALLRARAALVSGDVKGAASGFKTLRENHPGSLSAASSYIVEGRHLAASGQHAAALDVFTEGYESNRKANDPAVIAIAHDSLFSAAIEALTIADKRGGKMTEKSLDLLDQLTKDPSLSKNPNATNIFHRARLMQGDILRQLNEFDSAYKLYEDLSRTHPNHPDRLRADIARADCLLEKADSRPEFYSVAAAEYERLYNLPGCPEDLAAEAGYKRALAVSRSPVKGSSNALANASLARREASKLIWLQTNELLNGSGALGPKGRHWVARSLFLLAELEAKEGRPTEARAALRKLLETNAAQPDESKRLPGAAIAKQTLETLSTTTPTASGKP